MNIRGVKSSITMTLYMLFLMSGVITLNTTTASSHGLGYRLLENDKTKVVEFRYSDGSALSFAEVEVWSPGDVEIEFQNGRTDKNGRFSFYPDAPGIWSITISDGMGHAAKAQCEIAPKGQDSTLTQIEFQETGNNRIIPTILGISLIFNLAMLIRRKKVNEQT